MNEWLMLIIASIAGSLVSLIGGMALLAKKISVEKVQRIAVPFAAGALLAAAFLDLLPEAFEHAESMTKGAALVLSGFVLFFVLERFLGWFHHHHDHHDRDLRTKKRSHPTRSLIVVGDTLHNAIDGMVIGAAFLADPVLGVVATLAIAAHEIPQEIGDFGVLLALGMRRRTVLIVNVVSAVATIVSAVAVYGLGDAITPLQPILLALAAGMFIYIAASDLIPTIHDEPKTKVANYQTIILLFGILFVGVTTTLVHGFLEDSGAHSESHQEETHSHDHEH